MKVAQINGGVFGSTGTIMFGIARAVAQEGGETVCFAPVTVSNRWEQPRHPYEKIGCFQSRRVNVLLDRITGLHGCWAVFATWHLLRKLSKFQPDLLQLHSLHNGFVNLPMLFGYIKKHRIKTVWTLHDCWAFTGHCPHFDMVGCQKWKTGCMQCPQYRAYPKSKWDHSRYQYSAKKKWFTGVENLTLVAPSQWLADLLKDSFLKEYPVHVIHNGIDLKLFRPTPGDFREKCGCTDKFLVLGVAFGWDERKGLDVFCDLAHRLDKRKYRIVLVGMDDRTERKLPEHIITIPRTQNRVQLAELYAAADVFVNPTREDTYPTVNMEALACGTPIVTFETGGCPEISDSRCGSVVAKNDMEGLEREIIRVCETKPYSRRACLERAQTFDELEKFMDYVNLYRSIL